MLLLLILHSPQVAEAADGAADDKATTSINTPVALNVLTNDQAKSVFVESTAPAHGIVSSSSSGELTYLPDANYVGPDAFSYTALGSAGVPSTATVSVTVSGAVTATEARDDTGFPSEDEPVLIYVLANDAAGPNSGPLSATIETGPDNGTAEPQPDGSILYVPNPNWHGLDTFTYRADDGPTSDTALVEVSVASIPDSPNAGDDVVLTNQGASAEIDVLINDSEPEGDSVSFVANTSPLYGTATWQDGAGMITYAPLPNFYGSDQFTYTIADRDGSDTATVTMIVDGLPLAVADTVVADQNTPIVIDVLANDADPEASTVLLIRSTQPANGRVELDPEGAFLTYTSAPDFQGQDFFAYTIVDEQGNEATGSTTVSVMAGANQPPIAVDDEFLIAEDSVGNTLDILSNDHDPDANAMSLSIDSTPLHGEVTVDALQQVIYVPEAGFSGQDSFTYSTSDGNGGLARATVTIDVMGTNDVPVTAPDWAETTEDTPVTIAVLLNDFDADGDLLTVESVSEPALGSTSMTSDGGIEFVPEADVSGVDQFTYSVGDGNGGWATTTVDIIVRAANDAPAPIDDDVSTAINTAIVIRILDNDLDADGDIPLTVSIESAPKHGVAALQPDRTLLYTPEKDFEGTVSFAYRLWDPYTASAAAKVTVVVGEPNTEPVGAKDTAATTVNADISLDVLANDTDADGDILTINKVSQPKHGTVSITRDDHLLYTPKDGYSGPDVFKYVVVDGQGGTDSVMVKITVNEDGDTG